MNDLDPALLAAIGGADAEVAAEYRRVVVALADAQIDLYNTLCELHGDTKDGVVVHELIGVMTGSVLHTINDTVAEKDHLHAVWIAKDVLKRAYKALLHGKSIDEHIASLGDG